MYDKRIDRANSELSKLIIGQTMTIEDGSSLSQSETHLSVFRNLIEEDCDMLRDVINTRLLPRMVAHGFPVEGLTFNWDYSVDYTPEQQLAYETMLLNNFEIDADYFIEKYGVPIGEGCAIIRDCFKKEGKSRAAIIQKHYLYKMQRLTKEKYNLDANGKILAVTFDKKRNKHLYHAAIAVSKILQRDDLEHLDELLGQAKYSGESDLTHDRTDNFKYFYYFEADLHGEVVRINVGKLLDPDTKNKRKRYKYIVYSINDKEKKKRRG